MVTKKFLRRTWSRYPKLGRKRKKKQVWRRPTGRDNKMREKRKGYPAPVGIGHRTNKSERDKINGRVAVIVRNIKDLEKLNKDAGIILGNVGKKKKLEILKQAKEKKLKVIGINMNKFIEQNEKIKEENKSEGKRK